MIIDYLSCFFAIIAIPAFNHRDFAINHKIKQLQGLGIKINIFLDLFNSIFKNSNNISDRKR